MLSSDKNVENIAQLIGVLRHYLGLQAEYVKLDLIDKVVRLLTAAALTILLLLIGVAVMMFFSFAVAHWLATYIGMRWPSWWSHCSTWLCSFCSSPIVSPGLNGHW